jgi:hypothetical protein
VKTKLKPTRMPIPEAARSNTWFYGSSIIGTAGSNSVGGTDASSVVSIVLSLRQADNSCREVLLRVACLNVIVEALRGDSDPLGLLIHYV